jgi:hypothetical protein
MNDDFQIEEARWIPNIGRFIVDFAYIEDSLYRVIQSHLKNTQISYKNLRDTFDIQLALFENIFISDISETEEIKELINKFTTEADRLKSIRNAIAHNSLGLMFERKVTGEMEMIGFEIENKTNQNISINYDTFVEHMEALKVCRGNLEKLMEIFEENQFALIQGEDVE